MTDNTITLTNDSGIVFTARLLQKGQNYGLDDKLTWDRETPVIEYYFPKHKIHGPRGYFIGSWSVDIILGHTPGAGHLLDGGNTELTLAPRNVTAVQRLIRDSLPEYALINEHEGHDITHRHTQTAIGEVMFKNGRAVHGLVVDSIPLSETVYYCTECDREVSLAELGLNADDID